MHDVSMWRLIWPGTMYVYIAMSLLCHKYYAYIAYTYMYILLSGIVFNRLESMFLHCAPKATQQHSL